MDRPNILFLMSDEHRFDVAGFAGNDVVRTPVLDSLARDGVVFNNAYTPSPICIPGRQAMMSGQFPRTCNCEKFGQDLAPNTMTFANRFSQYAYQTCVSGKLHHVGRDQMQGWNMRVAPDMFVNEKFIEGRVEEEFKKYPAWHSRWKWSDVTEVHRAHAEDDSRNQRFDRNATAALGEFIEDYFLDMTYDRATPNRPVMMKLSLLQPHYPYVATRERLIYYFNRVKPFLDEPVFDHPFLGQRSIKVEEEATPREIRRATAAYYGMVEAVDTHFGQTLDALRNVGQNLDDWIIIYTTDHGEMLGEHGIWEKQKFFEGSARVPLIIRYPKRFKPRVVNENVNLCDIFATLCDLAGIPTPGGLDSRSMVPLMNGDSHAWRTRYRNETVSQFGARNLMIKQDDLKYHWYGSDVPEVLFDLKNDPKERRNAIDDPAHAIRVKEFRDRRDELGFAPEGKGDYVNAGYGNE